MIDPAEKEILQHRLMTFLEIKLISVWLLPTFFAFVLCLDSFLRPLHALATIVNSVFFLLVYQVIVLIWANYVRKTLSVPSQDGPRFCFVGNILFAIAGFIFLPLCSILLRDIMCFFMGLVIAAFMILPITRVNNLIKMLYFDNAPSKESHEASSPCPAIFHFVNMSRAMLALPLVLFAAVFLLLLIIKFSLKDAQIPWEMIWYVSGGFGLVGLAGGVLGGGFVLFLKQDATPSLFQRAYRYVFLLQWWYVRFVPSWYPGVMSHYIWDIPLEYQIVAFKWWLSHPNQPWPENMAELCKHIDTSKFDWQNPAEWDFVLSQAAGRFMDPKEPLEIGSKADLFK